MCKLATCIGGCGRVFTREEVQNGTAIYTKIKQKNYGYICPECAEKRGYFTKNTEVNGHENKGSKTTFGFELECSVASLEATNYLQTLGFLPTEDSTVYAELKAPTFEGLNSVKPCLKRIARFTESGNLSNVNQNGYECSTHLHIGSHDFHTSDMYNVRERKTELFFPLSERVKMQCDDDIIAIWGRENSGWAEWLNSDYNDADKHASFINLQHVSREKDKPTIEFRLAKFQSVDQYFKLMQFGRAVMDTCIIPFCENPTCRNAYKYGQKIVKVYEKMFNL